MVEIPIQRRVSGALIYNQPVIAFISLRSVFSQPEAQLRGKLVHQVFRSILQVEIGRIAITYGKSQPELLRHVELHTYTRFDNEKVRAFITLALPCIGMCATGYFILNPAPVKTSAAYHQWKRNMKGLLRKQGVFKQGSAVTSP